MGLRFVSALLLVGLLASVAFAAPIGVDVSNRIERVKSVADGVCTITAAQFLAKADPDGKDPLAMWRAEAKESVAVTDAFVRIDFTLVPEKGSDIKCRVELPLPDKWDGRLWGQGLICKTS